MVAISEVRQQNAGFKARKSGVDYVCVFVGGTNGIGQGTLKVLLSMLVTPTIYIVGRSSARWQRQHQALREINSEAKYVFIEAEVSLINEVDKACKQILSVESRVDYLCMSTGYFPMVGAIETKEGLEQCLVLSYYARIRFLNNLLPLLQKSSRPRVLTILSGGREGNLIEEDLGLSKSWTMMNLVTQSTTLKTLVLYRFSKQNPNISFIHAWPGLVRADEDRKPRPDPSASLLWRLSFAALKQVMGMLSYFRAISSEESGQRHAFLLTSDRFTPGTVWRIDAFSEVAPESEQLEGYRKAGWPDKVWEFTAGVWDDVLGRKSAAQVL